MTRFRQEVEGPDGWTGWIRPAPGYKIACCDCGLVHDFEFSHDENGEIIYRARQNARSTAARRRHRPSHTNPDRGTP